MDNNFEYISEFVDVAKVQENDYCVKCGKQALRVSNGIEVGNIFKLGTKYTEAMKMTYFDQNSKAQTTIKNKMNKQKRYIGLVITKNFYAA